MPAGRGYGSKKMKVGTPARSVTGRKAMGKGGRTLKRKK